MGCVTQAGEQGFAFGRNAVLASRLPETVPAVTIDRQCGSSQRAIQFAAQAIMLGTQDVVIAAGAESMTRVPMFSSITLHEQAGVGVGPLSAAIQKRYGVAAFCQFDGVEMVARKYGFNREMLAAYVVESHRRAAVATEVGAFSREIIPLAIDEVSALRARASATGPIWSPLGR
jgi:acetyl-CoA C-acetyltransferase